MSTATFTRRISLVLVLALVSTACGDGPATVGERKEFGAVCEKANDGKRVAVEGYLRFPESFTGSQSAVLRLYQGPDFKGAPIGVQVSIGTQANQMEMPPKQYSDADLKVHLADGGVVGAGTKVRVSGKVYFPMVAQDFTCSLENPLFERAQ